MDEYLTKGEHSEYKESQDKENRRINKRLELLENTVNQINDLTLSVQKLANNMESMLNKQESECRYAHNAACCFQSHLKTKQAFCQG